MPEQKPNSDITIRSGLPTIISNPPPTKPPRHQPDTPVNKKFAIQKSKPKKRQPVTTDAPTPDAPPPPGETDNEPAPPS